MSETCSRFVDGQECWEGWLMHFIVHDKETGLSYEVQVCYEHAQEWLAKTIEAKAS